MADRPKSQRRSSPAVTTFKRELTPAQRRQRLIERIEFVVLLPFVLITYLPYKLYRKCTAFRRIVSVTERQAAGYVRDNGTISYHQTLYFSRKFPAIRPGKVNLFLTMDSHIVFDEQHRTVSFNTLDRQLNTHELAIIVCEQFGWTLSGFKPTDLPVSMDPVSVSFNTSDSQHTS